MVEQHIPGMLYADDDVLLADNQRGIQPFTNIYGREATDLRLKYSTEKSGTVVFNYSITDAVSIQYGEIPRVKEYKYLGGWMNEGLNYLKLTRNHLKLKESEMQL